MATTAILIILLIICISIILAYEETQAQRAQKKTRIEEMSRQYKNRLKTA